MNNYVYRVWRPWSNVERCSPRRFADICVRHPQELSFWHSSTTVGERNRTPTPPMVTSYFYLLAAGLSLFRLLGLSACSVNFCFAEGGGSHNPNPPMSVSKSVFFLPADGLPQLISPVWLKLSSLHEPWSEGRLDLWKLLQEKNLRWMCSCFTDVRPLIYSI